MCGRESCKAQNVVQRYVCYKCNWRINPDDWRDQFGELTLDEGEQGIPSRAKRKPRGGEKEKKEEGPSYARDADFSQGHSLVPKRK